MKKSNLIWTFLLAVLTLANAQEQGDLDTARRLFFVDEMPLAPKLITDRPSFSESANIMEPGWVQYEGGYLSKWSTELQVTQLTSISHEWENALRVGLTRRFELRLGVQARTLSETSPSIFVPMRRTGIPPMSLGYRYNILRGKHSLLSTSGSFRSPYIAFGGFLAPATGNMVLFDQRLIWQQYLTPWWSYNVNAVVAGGLISSRGYVDQLFYSAMTSISLSEEWSVYGEHHAGWMFANPFWNGTPMVNFGVTKLFADVFQFDLRYGWNVSSILGTSPLTQGGYVGFGVSYLFRGPEFLVH